jgi:hypothetical protein
MNIRFAILIAAVLAVSSAARAAQENPSLRPGMGRCFYVAPDGKPDGDGSKEKPWDFKTGCDSNPAIQPGDTVWLRGGEYRINIRAPQKDAPNLNIPEKDWVYFKMKGTAEKPIMVAPAPGESPRFVADLRIYSSYVWFWGLDVTGPDDHRTSKQVTSWPTDVTCTGITVAVNSKQQHPGLKFIHNVVHDNNACGIGFWQEAVDAELYGSVFWYDGWRAPDRGHGHAVYVQNLEGTKRIENNIIFKNFCYGIQAYGTSNARLEGYHIEGNIMFQNGAPCGPNAREGDDKDLQYGLILGGGAPVKRSAVIDNCFYNKDLNRPVISIGYYGGVNNEDLRLTGNYIIGSAYFFKKWQKVEQKGNLIYGKRITEQPDPFLDRNATQILTERPKGAKVFIRPSKYEEGRAHAAIYNWDLADAVDVDASGFLKAGDGYEVIDAQDYFGKAIASGKFDGKTVSVPMKGLKTPMPAGLDEPMCAHTAPEFGAFIIRKAK